MKSISSLVKWILFVPVSLLSIGLTVFSVAAPDSFASTFSGDRNTVAKIVTVAILILFVVSYVLALFDKKTSPAHLLKKNYACGALAIISAMAMAASAAYEVTKMVNRDDIRVMSLITAALAALSGVAMLYVGLNHFSGANTPKPIALLYLTLPVWCGAHLIDRFLSHTDSPVAAADTMDLIMFVALAMFFINAMMIHSLIIGKNTVNSAITFGLPAVVASIVYGLINMFSAAASLRFIAFDLLAGIVYILLGLYVLCFTIELSFKSKTVNEQIIAGDADESNGFSEEYYADEEEAEAEETEAQDDEEEFDAESSYDVEDDYATVNLDGDSPADESEDEYATVNIKDESDADVADELLKAAVINDEANDESRVSLQELKEEAESSEDQDDNDMFFNKKNKEENKLKGPTTREPVSFEDEDFILSANNVESYEPVFDESEDISAFILESRDKEEPKNKRSYVDRLDEIDKLIISIQGGDAKKEDQ